MNILASGMEEGWSEPEYENRVDSLPPLDESFGDPLPDFKAEIQDGRIFIIALVILGLLALGWIVARFMEKREKSSKELDHMIKDLEDRRDNQ